jgi:hypothetical protein
MAFWIDRQASVPGPGVHALIIGVSDYTYLPEEGQLPEIGRETLGLTKVDIPATGAYLVGKWLRDKYWHPTHRVKTIRLLLSPSQHEISPTVAKDSALDANDRAELASVGKAAPASTENVQQALLDWQAECDNHPEDIAFLYISGHGIQWGDKDDGIVLLQDFSKNKLFLNQSVGMRSVAKGMSGANMPLSQLYFVDACRIHPDEYRKFEFAGAPIGLPSGFKGTEDLRSAPIFYAACPQTTAKGRPNRGTYFAEALVDCFDFAGLMGPVPNSALAVARSYWHISVTQLGEKLQTQVTEVAKRDGETQEIVPGGVLRPAVFCAVPVPPPVTVTVNVDPAAAAQVAVAELWEDYGVTRIGCKTSCQPPPATFQSVPPGLYILQVTASPLFPAPRLKQLNAQPPTSDIAIKFL